MKKIVLTSLLSVFVATAAANAAEPLGNPMYRPNEKMFYGFTDFATNSDYNDLVWDQEFGYGITDKMSVFLLTGFTGTFPDVGDSEYTWDKLGLGTSYRYMDGANVKADAYGKVRQDYSYNLTNDFTQELRASGTTWTAGTNVGYVTEGWTIAGVAELNYLDIADSSEYLTNMTFGAKGLYTVAPQWDLVGGVNYTFALDNSDGVFTEKILDVKVGANYNINQAMFIGVYGTKGYIMESGAENDDVYGMGARFGFQF